jgi:hypothetical protein
MDPGVFGTLQPASGSPEEICERTITALEDWGKRKSALERA